MKSRPFSRFIAFGRRHIGLVVLLVGFGYIYASTLNYNGMFMWDEAEYASLARSLSQGKGLTIGGVPNALRPPLLPLSSAASMMLLQEESDKAATLPIILFSLLAIGLVYGCTTLAFDRLTGWLAGAFVGITPSFWSYTGVLLSEMPFIACFVGAVLFFSLGQERAPAFFYASWACWAGALLSRYTALLFGPIALLLLIATLWVRKDNRWQLIVNRHFWLSPFVAAILLLPWLIRQGSTFGNPWVGFQQASIQLQIYAPEVAMPWWFYIAELPALVTWIPLLLLSVGAFWGVRRRNLLVIHSLIVCVFFLIWFSAYRYKETRFVVGIIPFLSLMAAVGVTRFLAHPSWLQRWRLERLRPITVALIIWLGTWGYAYQQIQPIFSQSVTLGYPTLLEAAQTIQEHAAPDAPMYGDNTPQLVWYLQRPTFNLPPEDDLFEALTADSWVIVTNYERGQQPYAQSLVGYVTPEALEAGDAYVFQTGMFSTVLLRGGWLRQQIAPTVSI